MKKIICITGMDGVGKSTLVDALATKLPSHVANIWDLLASPITSLPFQSKKQIDDFLCAITPDSRMLFLAHALKYSMDAAMQTNAEYLLLNSYYYKYLATEMALGADSQLAQHIAASFPQPDLVLELTLSVDLAAERKQGLSRYECGLATEPSKEKFLTFQQSAAAYWLAFRDDSWQKLDARLSPEELLEQALEKIKAWENQRQD